MTKIREYLVRTPDGHDHGRDESLADTMSAADRLGDGATVVALDELLLPIRENGVEKIVYTAGEAGDHRSGLIKCPYPRCTYDATSAVDLDEHLIAMPTEAPEHWRGDDDALPKRRPRTFSPPPWLA